MSECGPRISTMVFDSFHQPVAWTASNRKILQDGKNIKCLSWCSMIPFPFNTANDLTTYDWMEMKMLHFNSEKIVIVIAVLASISTIKINFGWFSIHYNARLQDIVMIIMRIINFLYIELCRVISYWILWKLLLKWIWLLILWWLTHWLSCYYYYYILPHSHLLINYIAIIGWNIV